MRKKSKKKRRAVRRIRLPSEDGATRINAEGDGPVSREAVIWAFRLFIGCEPRSEEDVAFHRQHLTLASLRLAFASTYEFAEYLRLHKPVSYCAPLFLLHPVEHKVPWRFAPPALSAPDSQLCTNSQLTEEAFFHWCNVMHLEPQAHRKLWEACYILSVLHAKGMLQGGRRGLGFGVGGEALPAVFAARDISVTATDAPPELIAGHGWESTGQHASELAALNRPDIIPLDRLQQLVTFRPVDMNNIPDDLQDFDFCWSSCALEHLGSLEHGMRFVEASLRTLRPGGWAVHTTEFNLSSNDATFEAPTLSIYRKRDIELLASRLQGAGHEVLPLNFHPGTAPMDEYIDLPPYEKHPVRIQVAQYAITSIGLAVRKSSS